MPNLDDEFYKLNKLIDYYSGNCGTGAGGFRSGNTCAKGHKSPSKPPTRAIRLRPRSEAHVHAVRKVQAALEAREAINKQLAAGGPGSADYEVGVYKTLRKQAGEAMKAAGLLPTAAQGRGRGLGVGHGVGPTPTLEPTLPLPPSLALGGRPGETGEGGVGETSPSPRLPAWQRRKRLLSKLNDALLAVEEQRHGSERDYNKARDKAIDFVKSKQVKIESPREFEALVEMFRGMPRAQHEEIERKFLLTKKRLAKVRGGEGKDVRTGGYYTGD